MPEPGAMTLGGAPYAASKEDNSRQVLISFASPPETRNNRLERSHIGEFISSVLADPSEKFQILTSLHRTNT